MRNCWLRGKGLTQLQQLPKRSRRCSSRRFKATATTSRYFAFHVVLNGSQLDIAISQGFWECKQGFIWRPLVCKVVEMVNVILFPNPFAYDMGKVFMCVFSLPGFTGLLSSPLPAENQQANSETGAWSDSPGSWWLKAWSCRIRDLYFAGIHLHYHIPFLNFNLFIRTRDSFVYYMWAYKQRRAQQLGLLLSTLSSVFFP